MTVDKCPQVLQQLVHEDYGLRWKILRFSGKTTHPHRKNQENSFKITPPHKTLLAAAFCNSPLPKSMHFKVDYTAYRG
jgi:hypothetical protein